MVLKIAILGERFAPSPQWYMDTILNLIKLVCLHGRLYRHWYQPVLLYVTLTTFDCCLTCAVFFVSIVASNEI